nr:serine/threonine-protein kinase [Kofleriaceae bacterium]
MEIYARLDEAREVGRDDLIALINERLSNFVTSAVSGQRAPLAAAATRVGQALIAQHSAALETQFDLAVYEHTKKQTSAVPAPGTPAIHVNSPIRTRVVVVERVAPTIQLGPSAFVEQPEESDENASLQVGSWIVGARIGSGSYGNIYRCRHLITEQEAAAKLVATDGKDGVDRFRREAACLGTLAHPSIPRIIDAGFVRNESLAYLVQDHLIGADLQRLLNHGWRPTEEEVLEILRQLTSPLTLAHDSGIIHRDLKPSNLFLETVGDCRRLRLLDFGCAKLFGATRLTSVGSVIGAIAYQPPEAFDSDSDLAATADLWSIGVTAYELVTGRHPFLAEDYSKTISRIMSLEFQRLDAAAFPQISSVVDRCLRLAPGERPPNAEALNDLIGGSPREASATAPARASPARASLSRSPRSAAPPAEQPLGESKQLPTVAMAIPRVAVGSIDLSDVKPDETAEYQVELAIQPSEPSTIIASELMTSLRGLIDRGIEKAVIQMLLRAGPEQATGGYRWRTQNRPYLNVLNKWELEVLDGSQLAFRWAVFRSGKDVYIETLDLLDCVVLPFALYHDAVTTACEAVSEEPHGNVVAKLTVAASNAPTLKDDIRAVTKTMYAPRSESSFQLSLTMRWSLAPQLKAKRLLNAALARFIVERDRFGEPQANPPIIRLDDAGYERYLTMAGVAVT